MNKLKHYFLKLCIGIIVLGINVFNFIGCNKETKDLEPIFEFEESATKSTRKDRFDYEKMGIITFHFKNTDMLDEDDNIVFYTEGRLRGIVHSHEDLTPFRFEPDKYTFNSEYLHRNVNCEVKDANTRLYIVIDYKKRTITQTYNSNKSK